MLEAKKPLVEIDNLAVSFRQPGGRSSFRAVDGVSLAIRPGEVLGLVGESGSGKTTLAKTVLRLYEPSEGRLTFEGVDITRLGQAALRPMRRHMQMIFQDPLSSFNPRVRIGDAIALPLRMHAGVTSSDMADRLKALLRQVGLGPQFIDRYPHEMSGGQLQRVAIARALAVNPKLIVADEAVSKLDVSVRAQILNLLRDIQASTGVALLFITHDLRVARYLCNRIGVMFFGRMVEIGTTEDVFSKPRHPYTRALLSTLDDDGDVLGALDLPAPAGSGCRYRTRCANARGECADRRPDLQKTTDCKQLVACPYVLSD